MDLILENIQPEQVQVFKKMAKLLSIRTKIRNKNLSESEEDKALFTAMEEGLKTENLTETEKNNFIDSLGK
ncbi:MAG: hypothetical protein ACK4NY_07515 [Spirosomataceae bacterium]